MKTSNLTYVTNRVAKNGDQYKIEIGLNDECHNGHCDFHITGDIWEPNKPKTDRNMITCGAIGEYIVKEFPEFAIFERLHLSDSKGAPMFALGNGIYHFINSSKEVAMNYLRINEEEYDVLLNCVDDKYYFAYALENMLIPERWEKEAKKGIKILEGLTDNEFIDSSTRYQYTPLTSEQNADIKDKLYSGYYSLEAIKERKEAALEAEKQKKINYLKKELAKDILKLKNNYKVKVYILVSGLNIDNFIYYEHLNKGVFNWMERDKITQEEFDNFMKEIDYSKLPKNIIFEIKK